MEEILFAQKGQLGFITLNRASALNALTLPMIQAMQQQLYHWKEDQSIKAVVLRAVPGSAFCAGGDVRWLYNAGRNKDLEQIQFFWHEYRLNHFIHHFTKPYITLMDGMTMGGGVGISLHSSHAVGSERFIFAMPETSIGFFPDIGASHLLTRCPGSLGTYLGLTGNRIGAQDALKVGLIKQVVSSEQMEQVVDALMDEDLSRDAFLRVTECINAYAMPQAEAQISQLQPLIDACFSHPTVELIKEALSGFDDEVWAAGVEKVLEKKSPLSLKVTLAQLQKAKSLSLAECLEMDFDLVRHFMQGSDFYEGVRALLVEKDKNPQWNPDSLDKVSDALVVNYFEPFNKGLELM